MSVIANERQAADQWAIGLQLASVLYYIPSSAAVERTFSLFNKQQELAMDYIESSCYSITKETKEFFDFIESITSKFVSIIGCI